MRGLAQGWELLKLRDVATLKTGPFGSALHKADYIVGGIPLINPTHIREGKLFPSTEVSVSPETAQHLTEYRLNEGDIVMGRRGEMGRCAVVPEHAQDWLCGTGSVVVKSTFAAHPKYLQRFLTAPATVAALIGDSVGSTMINLNQGVLLGLDIPLAPLPEQKRIADKLDSVLARVDACRDRLDRLPALLKRFRQSILAAATSGRLTEDWREINSTEKKWAETSLENIADAIFDGPFGSNLKSDDYTARGVRVVRLENIGHLFFDASKETYISDEKYQTLAKHTLGANDLLFSSFVDEEVRVCLLPNNLPTIAINKADCFCLRVNAAKCLPVYLGYRLACKTTYLELKELVHGATRPRINLKQLKQYSIGFPPLPEQTEIVRRVETLFAFADRLEARLTAARQQIGQLTPALLAKAFRGELVAQDPADEPAAELLKRLAAQREATPRAKRGRAKA